MRFREFFQEKDTDGRDARATINPGKLPHLAVSRPRAEKLFRRTIEFAEFRMSNSLKAPQTSR